MTLPAPRHHRLVQIFALSALALLGACGKRRLPLDDTPARPAAVPALSAALVGTFNYAGTQCGDETKKSVNGAKGGQLTVRTESLSRWYYNQLSDTATCWASERYSVVASGDNGVSAKVKMTQFIQHCEAPLDEDDPDAWQRTDIWTDDAIAMPLSAQDTAPRDIKFILDADGAMRIEHLGGDPRCQGKPIDLFNLLKI